MPDTPADLSRRLIRASDRATLATTLADGSNAPYASLVMTACGHDASPLLLISDLAEHTKNLRTDPRCSLLFDGTTGLETPLTGARISVQGTAREVQDEARLDRYCRRHPSASGYAGFADFHLFQVDMERVHLVAGFGRIHWIDARDVLLDCSSYETLAAAEADIISHMNADHSDAVGLYANVLAGLPEAGWRLTGVDPEGCDLALGGRTARLDFDAIADNAEAARRELVKLTRKAKQKAG